MGRRDLFASPADLQAPRQPFWREGSRESWRSDGYAAAARSHFGFLVGLQESPIRSRRRCHPVSAIARPSGPAHAPAASGRSQERRLLHDHRAQFRWKLLPANRSLSHANRVSGRAFTAHQETDFGRQRRKATIRFRTVFVSRRDRERTISRPQSAGAAHPRRYEANSRIIRSRVMPRPNQPNMVIRMQRRSPCSSTCESPS